MNGLSKKLAGLIQQYKEVQAGAPAAAAQTSDDTWDKIDRLRKKRETMAKSLVSPRQITHKR